MENFDETNIVSLVCKRKESGCAVWTGQ